MSKKVFLGKVISHKMQGVVVVAVELPKKHPIYGKEIKNTKKFKAKNVAGSLLKDTVMIEESRPYAKGVTWQVTKVLSSEAVKEKVKKTK